MKTIKISDDLHEKLKIEAAKQHISIIELICKIVKQFFIGSIMLSLISCATTYTKGPDHVNYKRYQHDEKIEIGMTMREVMDRFGSPAEVKKTYNSGWVIEYVYYRSIYCKAIYCFVRFDIDSKEVVSFYNFRQEFNNYVNVD